MRDSRTYKEVFAKQPPMRICSHIITICVIIALIVKIIMVLTGHPDGKLYSHFAIIGVCLLPYIFQLAIKLRLSDFVMLFYIIYVLMSGVLGGSFSLFDKLPGYDKVVHTAFGYVSSMLGLLIICKMSDYNKLSPVFVGIMIFSVSMMTAAVWEIFEFVGGRIFGMYWQGYPVESESGPVISVLDTMMDICVHFAGAIVFTVNFILHRTLKKNLLIGSMVKDFTYKNIEIADKDSDQKTDSAQGL